MKLIKDFSIIFVPPILAIVIMFGAVVAYVASLPSIESGSGPAVAMADTQPDLTGLILNTQSDASSTPSISVGSGATSTPVLALSTPAVGTSGSHGDNNSNQKTSQNTSDELVITSAPTSTPSQSPAPEAPQVAQTVRPTAPLVLSASISPANDSNNQFTVTAEAAAAGDTVSLSLSCPTGVSAVLLTDNANQCNEPIVMSKDGNQFSTTLIFTNSATNNLTVPITALEFNDQSISTSTDLSVALPPTGFTIANYQSLAFSNISASYVAGGPNQTLLWSQTGYGDTDYGLLVLEDTSGNQAAGPFENYIQSLYIPSLGNGSVTFSFNQNVLPGSYRFAILDDNNNQIAESSYFNITAAAANQAQPGNVAPEISLTSGDISGMKNVAAGTNQVLDWNSNGQSCITSSNNIADQSWSNAAVVPPQGSHITPLLSTGQYTYTLTCSQGNNGASISTTLVLNAQ